LEFSRYTGAAPGFPFRVRGYVTERQRSRRSLVLAFLVFTCSYALALDAPHTNIPGYDIQCGNCHWVHNSDSAPWESIPSSPDPEDDTINNRRCYACHDGSKTGIAAAKTHSHSTTSDKYWSAEGGWRTECVTCHDPHQQRQTRTWGAATYVTTGLQPAVGGWNAIDNWTEITVPSQITENYYGHYFLPDRNYPFFYKIISDTKNKNTFKVKGDVLETYVKTGGYAIVYGKNVRESISFENPGGEIVGGVVKLYRPSGSNGPGDSGNASTSVCYVCHTKGEHWSRVGDTAHNDQTECTSCHQHSIGFKPSCKACHGYPPVSDTAAPPDGLVWLSGAITGSTTAGAHNMHVNAKAIVCDACHYNSAGSGGTHNTGAITIGFYALGGNAQGGAYDGQKTANYDVTATTPATTVSKGGAKTCSSVYCHGATMIPNAGTDTTPVWDDPATGACGTCHGATAANPPTKGSHGKHATQYLDGYNYPCGLCHKDPSEDGSLHVNNKSEVVFSSDAKTNGGIYSGSQTMLDAYGTCTNVYCHSTIQSSPPGGAPTYRTTPTWGVNNSLGCGGCHDYYPQLASGSHQKHFEYPESQACYPCHNWTNSDDPCLACHDASTIEPRRDKHANGSIEVSFAPKYSGSYSGTPQPGDGYGSCSNTYCHSNGTSVSAGTIPGNTPPTWGSGSLPCNSCHGYPPDYANGSPKANSHPAHADAGITCDKCHYATTTDGSTIADTSSHVNKAYDLQPGSGVSFTYTYSPSGGSCSSISCHGDATHGDATWGVAGP
jgi:predicted CxxxxCH...CXXCH cytochrome family protein